MKSNTLSIIAASIIVLGGSFIVVDNILAKDEASELDKKAQESQRELQKQQQRPREFRPREGVNIKEDNSEDYSSEDRQADEPQQKLLEQQREQNKQLKDKQREQDKKLFEKEKENNKPNLEKKDKEYRPNQNDEGQDDSVDSLFEQINIGPEREKKVKDKCQEISDKISEHQNELKAKAEKRLGKYNKIINRLEAVSVKLSELGVDVTTYNSYVVEVKSKVNTLNTSIQNYIAVLQSDTTQLCTKDKAASEINTRKSDLKVIIEQDKAIRTYIKDTIISYLLTIKTESTTESNTPAN